MKALTLTQSWASLVALGEKRIETRSWPTRYRGEIAIHAAMGFPGWAKRQCFVPPFNITLNSHDLCPDTLPLGKVLCISPLIDCQSTDYVYFVDGLRNGLPNEEAFGNFGGDRFAWFLGPIVKVFDPPIYAKGMLGLWEWERR